MIDKAPVRGVFNCSTGELEEIPFTEEELAEYDERAAVDVPESASIEERIADAAAAAVGAVLPIVAPGSTAEQRGQAQGLARKAALDAVDPATS